MYYIIRFTLLLECSAEASCYHVHHYHCLVVLVELAVIVLAFQVIRIWLA
jgi:hypothetical protein